ncbi:Flp family type IVb pilin [Sphingomonas sanguinis]|jgi:pilus assembly protein Flp/PilA|uniref:Flp family type IVb pilin n=1 Tax=Sphingomonas sp. LC-1 TaxID=3110957 RepID=UPI0021BB4E2D|nr:Flp family type IVb pilin [Sphingomonas sp. LC-1]MCT8000409.1 Flp family type IVb pilin [Sphingomonas sp. LC-1]
MIASNLLRTLRHVCADTRGATAVEYGLILASIVVVLIVGLSQLGVSLQGVLQLLSNELGDAVR